MGKNFWRGLGWAVLIGCSLYFFVESIYCVGYKNGKASVECGRAQCMAEILKYSK